MPETHHSATNANLKALYDPYTFAKLIVEISRKSPDRRTSYSQLWTEIHGAPPHYPSFFKAFAEPFTRLGEAVIAAKMPYIGALVVGKQSRKPSKNAVDNMAGFIVRHAIPIAPEKAEIYLQEQADTAAALTDAELEKLRRAA